MKQIKLDILESIQLIILIKKFNFCILIEKKIYLNQQKKINLKLNKND